MKSNSIVIKPKVANQKFRKNKKMKISPISNINQAGGGTANISESMISLPTQLNKKHVFDESTRQKLMIFQLFKMGFRDSNIERAILYGGAKNIEEILNMIIPNELSQMEHKFVSNNQNGSALDRLQYSTA